MSVTAALGAVMGLAAQLAGSALFGWAALSKWQDRSGFAAAVAGYGLLPARMAAPVASAILLAESLVCLLLLTPASAAAAAAGIFMLLIFAFAITINLMRGRIDIDCGCGGVSRRGRLHAGLIARNIGMAMLLAAALDAPAIELHWIGHFTAVGLAVCILTFYAAIDLVAATLPDARARHGH